MADLQDASTGLSGNEIKPYHIHVSSKYLDLTRQKLELTRLPHETTEFKSHDWWEPKSQIEPLVDFWLEKYDWRDQESAFNNQLPQFRTAITVSGSEKPVRLHFVHVRSSHAAAVPLLLIPPFPFTNLSLGHLVRPLTEPEDPDKQQPFHLVIPSLPGLGFSDALPANTCVISATADMLSVVMSRLSYSYYLISNTASAASSPGGVDWKLANHLAVHYSHNCLGAHFINPPLAAPSLTGSPLEWMKWSIAKFFGASMFGYKNEDYRALNRIEPNRAPSAQLLSKHHAEVSSFEPNTPSFALCDSPVGLLALVLKVIRVLGAMKEFSAEEIVTFTQIAWLPGPEAAMRFWARCLASTERTPNKPGAKPTVAVTVFSGDDGERSDGDAEARDVLPRPALASYVCPTWANVSYKLVHAQRVPGNPGLVAWDCPEHISEGVRGLARRLLSVDGRLRGPEEPSTVPLRGIVVQPDSTVSGADQGTKPPLTGMPALTPQAEASWRLERIRETSETPKRSQQDGDPDFDGASPDTLVVTPPGS
ncbi:putative epoxide hydrolase 2 [Colletotrichum chlorophyti]|uniref:Putative epoxide hydrolase 2 n=1 Tax=Colletotrichum chlorophyti TaxID=708187 RepID=A0A1Q8RKS5_9PEZI|nr:putative epoxide hydrolase 2 [Colletotrichum chlorophyti]